MTVASCLVLFVVVAVATASASDDPISRTSDAHDVVPTAASSDEKEDEAAGAIEKPIDGEEDETMNSHDDSPPLSYSAEERKYNYDFYSQLYQRITDCRKKLADDACKRDWSCKYRNEKLLEDAMHKYRAIPTATKDYYLRLEMYKKDIATMYWQKRKACIQKILDLNSKRKATTADHKRLLALVKAKGYNEINLQDTWNYLGGNNILSYC